MGALPAALAARGHRVMVVAPRHTNGGADAGRYADAAEVGTEAGPRVAVQLGGARHEVTYYRAEADGVDWVFVDHPVFQRPGTPYGEGAWGLALEPPPPARGRAARQAGRRTIPAPLDSVALGPHPVPSPPTPTLRRPQVTPRGRLRTTSSASPCCRAPPSRRRCSSSWGPTAGAAAARRGAGVRPGVAGPCMHHSAEPQGFPPTTHGAPPPPCRTPSPPPHHHHPGPMARTSPLSPTTGTPRCCRPSCQQTSSPRACTPTPPACWRFTTWRTRCVGRRRLLGARAAPRPPAPLRSGPATEPCPHITLSIPRLPPPGCVPGKPVQQPLAAGQHVQPLGVAPAAGLIGAAGAAAARPHRADRQRAQGGGWPRGGALLLAAQCSRCSPLTGAR
jgi:hypothetical protein